MVLSQTINAITLCISVILIIWVTMLSAKISRMKQENFLIQNKITDIDHRLTTEQGTRSSQDWKLYNLIRSSLKVDKDLNKTKDF